MSELIKNILVGVTQGITEFFPISSDGHLIIVRQLLHMPDAGLIFDASLHFATLLAMVIYFWRDLADILRAVFIPGSLKPAEVILKRRLLWLIVIADIPPALAGFFGQSYFENNFRNLTFVSIAMVLSGLIFYVISRLKTKRKLKDLNVKDAISVGLAQVLAILPGVSRSGTTIATGLYYGLEPEAAARFSFLAGIPIIFLAGSFGLFEVFKTPGVQIDWTVLGVTFLAAFVSGLAAVWILLAIVKKASLKPFIPYLLIVGAALFVLQYLHLV
jgi:undecaprenyl-diphosphatase